MVDEDPVPAESTLADGLTHYFDGFTRYPTALLVTFDGFTRFQGFDLDSSVRDSVPVYSVLVD